MDQLWSQAGATDSNPRQVAQGQKRLKQANSQSPATHGNGPRPHGKEGVDGSSPSEGSAKSPPLTGISVQKDLLFVARAVGMEPFMELFAHATRPLPRQ